MKKRGRKKWEIAEGRVPGLMSSAASGRNPCAVRRDLPCKPEVMPVRSSAVISGLALYLHGILAGNLIGDLVDHHRSSYFLAGVSDSSLLLFRFTPFLLYFPLNFTSK